MLLPMENALKEAAADFRYLLERGYPRTASLTLVGNRYDLPRLSRQLLHRGVFPAAIAAGRRAKLLLMKDLAGQPLGVDGHNVLITLECAWRGLPLAAADDGFIRDVGELSRSFQASPVTDQALNLVADYLKRHRIDPVTILFDAPLSKSGELARHTQQRLAARGLTVTARAVPVPEQELLAFPGPIATSDTHLIDAHPQVVDLAGEIIRSQLADHAHIVLLR